jgi:hypothetical protein
LGFADREVESWFSSAGLKTGGSETIAPPSGEKLTVKLWLATAKSASRIKEAA